ncbi:protein CFAP20DC isoform X4 [Cervus canadensis]|uniref:protein CFAP20DC isoform X4 n=1 Tax=Cervus canadensis TaxID=1574408 RepID=UPI001CA385A9|nr:protein CFAP20DC isoform X4 [Cervus canadensis]
MFKNEYQGGAFVEIFSAQGKNPGAKWKILGSPSVIWKEFDKEVKSFVFVLEGSSQTNKIQLPKENKQILGLIQRFLVLQIYIPLGQDFSTELLHTEVFSSLCLLVVGLQPNRKAGITDLRNIKRRLYLSTVHKELSSTPLHAKIPLFMIKRKIWCNLCIDLVAFTNEIFKGAVFQSLDGITVSASCKLRKIFTLKYKPQDTADKDAGHDAPFPTDEPIDIIPRSCQLTTDVPQVTQLLNMTKLRQTEIKFGGHPLSSAESDQFINRGAVSTRNSKHQDVCHIAFGSKVLGPPPLSGRRNNMRLSNETIRSVGSKSNRSHQQSTVEKCVNSAEMLTLLLPESEAQRDKENIGQIKQTVPVLGTSSEDNRNDEHKAATVLTTMSQQRAETLNPRSPVPQSPDQADEWIFPENGDDMPYLASTTQSLLLGEDSCHTSCLCLEASKESEHDHQTEETQTVPKDVFTFSSRPRSAPHGKTQTMSPEACLFTLDLKEDTSVTRSDTQTEEDFYGGDSSEEDNHSVQGSPGPTTSPPELTQLTLESVLGKAAKCASKGYLKNAYAEGRTSENQNSMAKQIDIKDFETSFVPTPSLSPPGRHEYSPKIPDPIIKAKDLPAHQVSTSTNKTFLKEISEEKLKPIAELSEYDWRNYQPSEISDSELQMLASLRRQQNEELEDTGALYGLSASQVDNCNVSISTSSDDTTTWNSCLPPPVNQGRHYQKEMNPPSPSNPRDWLNMLSPPIVPPSQQSAERHQDSSGSLSVQVNLAPLITVSSILHGKYRAITSAALLPPGVDIPPTQGWSSRTNGEEELSAEEDEEVLTLLYDPCLNCYFDPQTGKYYELV